MTEASGVRLVFGGGGIDRQVNDAEGLIDDWRDKESQAGQLYLEHQPVTDADRLFLEDLAVTMLVNSQVGLRAAGGVFVHGPTLDLNSLPDTALEETDEAERQVVADLIGEVANWPGFGASVASKTLHKKRPALIPMLDNRAIFEAYMDSRWPERHTYGETVKDVPRIREALDSITRDLTRAENARSWTQLHATEPERSRIELFDMVWWRYFRKLEPR